MARIFTVSGNRDTGSLKVGFDVDVGGLIQIDGETSPRRITHVAGKGPKCHAYCKGAPAFPLGDVRATYLAPGQEVAAVA